MLLFLLSVHPATLDDVIFIKVNEYRATKGKKPYPRNKYLDQAALDHAKYQLMKGEQTHTGPPGMKDVDDRIKAAGYNAKGYGENVGFDRPDRWQYILKGWLGSSYHESNISGDYEDFGVGSASSDKIRYWAQTFGVPGDETAKAGRYEGDGANDETTGYQTKGYEGVSITPSEILPKWYVRQDGTLGPDLQEPTYGITWDLEPTGTGPGTGKPGTGKPGGGAKTAGADKTAGAGADKTAGAGADKTGGGAGAGGAGKTAGGGGGADKTAGGAGATPGGGSGGGAGATPGGGAGGGAGGGGAGGAGAGGAGGGGGAGAGSEGFDADCGICRAREVVPLLDQLSKKWLNK